MILYLVSFSGAQVDNLKDIVEDPAISLRCKALLNQRQEKIQVQHKLQSLLIRNNKMQKEARPTQNQVKNRLKLNLVQIKNNLKLNKMSVKSLEEKIVRKGCPGLKL